LPLYTDPPKAYLYFLGSFTQGFISDKYPKLKAGDDYSFFGFPTIDPMYSGAITGGADVLVMLKDTPASRALMTYLASAKAQEIWVKKGGFTAVNKSVSLDAYPDPLAKLVAQQLTSAPIYRFDGSDLMPSEVSDAFWKGTLDYIKDPTKLDSVLANIEKVSVDAYKK
jgi:alpha-glucoside transport system substrate-binding protein